jgi:adenosine deaminase
MSTNQWEIVRAWIRDSKLCNFHRHISGSLSPEFLSTQYRENLPASQEFQKRYALDPTQPDHIRNVISSSLSRVEDGWKNFEEAFNPSRFLLNNDPQFKFHQRCFQQVVVDSLEQSIGLVGIRATLGCHWRTPPKFTAALKVAVQGIIDGEKLTRDRVRGVLILGIRKDISPDAAKNALRNLLDVRTEWAYSNPAFSEKLYGVDSIGPEDSFDPSAFSSLFSEAFENKLSIFHHIGETWEDGRLLSKLQQIQRLISQHNISYLTNPVALLVNYETLNNNLYSKNSIQELITIQQQILSEVIHKSITLEISPTSNDILTQKKRRSEGWQFMPLKNIIQQGVRILVTDDDGSVFETDLLGEYQKLYFGTTSYGTIGLDEIKKLISDGQRVSRET